MSFRDEILCPATMPITRSSESICMGWTCGLELGLRHWNNSATTGSFLTSSEEPWSRVPGPPLSGSQPIVVGPGVDPVIWWAVSKDSPFCSGPVVCRWGRAWQVAGCLGRT